MHVHNTVVRVRRFGGADELEVVDAPLPQAKPGEVRVRITAASIEYTDVTIRKHLYPWVRKRPPFVMGYDFVGVIDQLGEGVTDFEVGDCVADMTMTGSNAAYRTRKARLLTRVPNGVDPAEAAAIILSWTTAYQLLHRSARVRPGQRVLVHGAAGAVGQALLVLGKKAGLELWGTCRAKNAQIVHDLGGIPIDYEHEDFTRVLPGGFDVVFDGIGEDAFRRSLASLAPGGLLSFYGYSAGVQAGLGGGDIGKSMARLWLQRWLPHGKRARSYSINVMRALHPAWFKQDLAALFDMLAKGEIHPRVAERISFERVADAHRRLETGGLDGKLVLFPSLEPPGALQPS